MSVTNKGSRENLSVTNKGSRENLAVKGVPEPPAAAAAAQDKPDSARGRLDMRDLLHEDPARSSWSGVSAPGQRQQHQQPQPQPIVSNAGDADLARLPPPPTRQPIPVLEYEPHELSTILEVDTPQTGGKSLAARASPPPPPAAEGGDGGADRASAARRYIEFGTGRHGAFSEDDRNSESKFSASGSSASSDVRSVIEVRPGMLKLGGGGGGGGVTATAVTAVGSGSGGGGGGAALTPEEKGEETLFRENVPESSTMTAAASLSRVSDWRPQDPHLPRPSQDVSATSSGQGFQSLELTLDSLTPRSVSMEDSRARRYLDFSGSEDAGGGRRRREEEEGVADVMRQARQFNQDLMAAIQQQSADVFDQSSLSSLSHTAADSSQNSQL